MNQNAGNQSPINDNGAAAPRGGISGLQAVGILLVIAAGGNYAWTQWRSPKVDQADPGGQVPVANALPISSRSLKGQNLLLLTAGSLRPDRLGYTGAVGVRTPAIDRLAGDGLRFDEARAVAPAALPAHASILSGTYPIHHKARVASIYAMDTSTPTLAGSLASAGYRTHAIVSSPIVDRTSGLNRGFDTFDDKLVRVLSKDDALRATRTADSAVDRALAWLGSADPRPFFLWVHLTDPHPPFAPPDALAREFAERRYDGEIAFVDEQIGRLLSHLDAAKLRDRTTIVLVGDHGLAFGEHGEYGNGCQAFETTLRIPLIMATPAQRGKPARIAQTVSQVDLAPTLLDLLGVSAPTGMDGAVLTRPLPADRAIFAEAVLGSAMYGWGMVAVMYRDSLKYIHAPKPELYDLAADPGETKNLFAERGAEAATMRAALVKALGDDALSARLPRPVRRFSFERQSVLNVMGYLVGAGGPEEEPATRVNPADMAGPLARLFEIRTAGSSTSAQEQALNQVRALARELPDFELAQRQLGIQYRLVREHDPAIEAFRRAIALAPWSTVPKLALVQGLLAKGEKRQAITELEGILRDHPDHAEAAYNLGQFLAEQSRWPEAAAAFRKAFEIDPELPSCAVALVHSMRQAKQTEELLSYLRGAAAAKPESSPITLALAEAFIQEEQYEEARKLLREAVKRNPTDELLPIRLAVLLIQHPDQNEQSPYEAATIMERLCEDSEYRDPGLLINLSTAYVGCNRFTDAISIAERARKLALAAGNDAMVKQLDAMLEQQRTKHRELLREEAPTAAP